MNSPSSPQAKKSRPAEKEVAFPGVPVEAIDAYAEALLAATAGVSLPLLSGEQRAAFQPGAATVRDVSDSIGALRFASQVVRRTGVTPERLEEALAYREALIQLRDSALRLALGADDGLVMLTGGGRVPDPDALTVLERAGLGDAVDPVLVSRAVATRRQGAEAT